jgi:hypothetical protein
MDLSRTRESGSIGVATRYQGLFWTVRLTVQEEGIFALYRGLGISLAACLPYEGLKFGAFDWLKKSDAARGVGERYGPAVSLLGSGSLAGMVAVVLTFPNDTVRRRMQLDGMNGAPIRYAHAIDCYRRVIREEGGRALYRGMTATILRAVPNTAIQFGVFESVRDYLDRRAVVMTSREIDCDS